MLISAKILSENFFLEKRVKKNGITVFVKKHLSAGLPDKTGIFSFCPAKTDKCPVNLSKETNILIINMLSVLQILILLSVLQKITIV